MFIVLVIRLFVFPAYTEARNNSRINPAWVFISPLADKQPITKITKIRKQLVSPVPSVTPTPHPQTSETPNQNPNVVGLLNQVNQYRVQNGLRTVIENDTVCAFARVRVAEVRQNFDHNGFEDRIKSGTLPYPGYARVTENLAKTSEPENVVPMWINSPGHAANMREDTPYVCIVASGEYYVYEGWKPN